MDGYVEVGGWLKIDRFNDIGAASQWLGVGWCLRIDKSGLNSKPPSLHFTGWPPYSGADEGHSTTVLKCP